MTTFTSWEVARRSTGAQLVLVLAFVVLSTAFFKAQVVDHDKYAMESSNNRLRALPLPAPRGYILDRNGLSIAENVPGYSVKLLSQREDTLRAMLARLTPFLPVDTINADAVVRKWRESPHQPVTVFASSDQSVVYKLEEHRALLPGLVVQKEPRRHYPLGAGVGHVVGYVAQINQTELDSLRYPGAESGDLVGKLGIEKQYDSLLRGTSGIRYVEVTARGRAVNGQASRNNVSPSRGANLTTTIDAPLQQFVDSMWRAEMPNMRGALVAMTPEGAILAYYSYPSYDPNVFVESYRALVSDSARPLYNRVIQGRYPPASPFKLATAAMGLRRNLVTMNTRMPQACSGGYQFGSRYYRCWKVGGHGSLDLAGAIATSCDVYFYQLGLKLGEQAIFEDGVKFGFADRSSIDLAPESRPIFPRDIKAYIDRRGANQWNRGEVLNLSIGQGANSQTLINMTSFYAALAGDGIKRAPYIVQGHQSAVTHDLGLTTLQLQGLRAAMAQVVESGTAAASGGRDLAVAGKTGTGQVTNQKDLAWFLSYAPATAPKIVVGILVEEGLHGSSIAKYAVRTIGRYLIGPDSAALKSADAVMLDGVKALVGGDTVPLQPSLPIDSAPPAPRPGARPR